MAIIKPFTTPHGVIATYHKILKAEIDINQAAINVVTAIYASAGARDAGGVPLWHEYASVPFSALTQDPRDLLYPMMAAYHASYLRGGAGDEEGFSQPGNNTISLTAEAVEVPSPIEPNVVPAG